MAIIDKAVSIIQSKTSKKTFKDTEIDWSIAEKKLTEPCRLRRVGSDAASLCVFRGAALVLNFGCPSASLHWHGLGHLGDVIATLASTN
jgi:fructose-1,6-bisphosphatase/inositol monophosphatase family enzyme